MNNPINKGLRPVLSSLASLGGKGSLKSFFGSRKGAILFLTVILAVGIFLRAYHFSDWLHFELDQSRDAKVIDLAVKNGPGDLPLLGPKAAGSFLRLGPIFYYFGYLSAKVFGNSPSGIAAIPLILSCLTLPLFYLFARRFFSQKISIMLLGVFSTSIFLVMYSRFSWNPNNLPFFTLATLYGLLRATDIDEKMKGWWLIIASLTLAVSTQLHFVAFVAFPIIAFLYLLLKRPGIGWKYWLASSLCFVFLYIPPIINDFKTGGTNIAEFEKVFVKKSIKSEHTIVEKIIRDIDKTSAGYFLLLSGNSQAELPKIRIPNIRPVFSCDEDCVKYTPLGIVALLSFLLGIFLLGWNMFNEKLKNKRNFLLLMAIWFLVSLGLFVPISYDLAPRFFLLVAPIPFVFLGFVLDFFEKKRRSFFSWMLIIFLVSSNLWFIRNRFQELANAPKEKFKISSDRILKENERVTLQQQLLVTDYMESIYKENHFPVYLNSEAFYRRSFLYHLEQRSIVRDDFRNTRYVYAEGNFFLIYPSSSKIESFYDNYENKYDIAEITEFGTLTVVRLVPKSEKINAVRQEFGPARKPTSALGVPVRCRWNEIMAVCNTDGSEVSTDDEAAIE